MLRLSTNRDLVRRCFQSSSTSMRWNSKICPSERYCELRIGYAVHASMYWVVEFKIDDAQTEIPGGGGGWDSYLGLGTNCETRGGLAHVLGQHIPICHGPAEKEVLRGRGMSAPACCEVFSSDVARRNDSMRQIAHMYMFPAPDICRASELLSSCGPAGSWGARERHGNRV